MITRVLFDLKVSVEQSRHKMVQNAMTCLNEHPFHKLHSSSMHVSIVLNLRSFDSMVRFALGVAGSF